MRKGFEGLSALVRDKLAEDPTSGHLFVFTNAARNRLKVLFWDGSGLWVCSKRLERGRFRWSSREGALGPGAKVRLCAAELSMLLDGLDELDYIRTQIAKIEAHERARPETIDTLHPNATR